MKNNHESCTYKLAKSTNSFLMLAVLEDATDTGLTGVSNITTDKPQYTNTNKKQSNVLSFFGKSISNEKRPLSPLQFDSKKVKKADSTKCAPSREPCICLTCFK